MNKKKVYLGGSLFSESEIAQRMLEANKLRELGYEVYNPIEAPFNNKEKLPTAVEIFEGDANEIMKCDIAFFEVSNQDPGVCAELGLLWGLGYSDHVKNKKVVCYYSDIRMATSNKYSGYHIPHGVNQFVVGMIEDMGGKIFTSSKEAIKYMEELINER